MRPRISALLIVLNEENAIGRALNSVKWADEIVVIDGGSRDATQAIAASHGARVLVRPFDGFASQRTFALSSTETDWVFGLDADEIVSDPLREEILQLLHGDPFSLAEGYYVKRNTYIRGKMIRNVIGNDWQLRLLQRKAAMVADVPVHESYVVTGERGYLRAGALDHFAFADVAHFIDKVNRYSTLWAPVESKKTHGVGLWHLMFSPFRMLFSNLILRKGLWGGTASITYCFLTAIARAMEVLKLYEQKRMVDGEDRPAKEPPL